MNTRPQAAVIARVRTFAFSGIEAVPVEVQVQISGGMPAFLLVGLPDKAVGEARERVRAALSAMGLALPPRRILINLAPADLLKEGSHFDLPLALGVLAAMDVVPREELYNYAALGELSLDGTLNSVAGVLPAAIGASGLDLGLICPASQGGEAAWAGRIEVLAAADLLSLINHFRGTPGADTAGNGWCRGIWPRTGPVRREGHGDRQACRGDRGRGCPQSADDRLARLGQVDAGRAAARTAAGSRSEGGAGSQHDLRIELYRRVLGEFVGRL